MRPGGPPTFEEEKEKFFRQLRERGKPPLEPQAARGDIEGRRRLRRASDNVCTCRPCYGFNHVVGEIAHTLFG